MQIMALGIGLMAMLLLTLVRTELIAEVAAVDAGGHAQPLRDQHPDRPAAGREGAISPSSSSPRPTSIRWCAAGWWRSAGAPGRPARLQGRARAGASSEREFNLSWARANRAGQQDRRGTVLGRPIRPSRSSPWRRASRRRLSIKVGRHAHLRRGAASRFTAPVTSLRKVDWDSFKPNFFVIASPEPAGGLPGELDHELPPAGRARGRRSRGWSSASRT